MFKKKKKEEFWHHSKQNGSKKILEVCILLFLSLLTGRGAFVYFNGSKQQRPIPFSPVDLNLVAKTNNQKQSVDILVLFVCF